MKPQSRDCEVLNVHGMKAGAQEESKAGARGPHDSRLVARVSCLNLLIWPAETFILFAVRIPTVWVSEALLWFHGAMSDCTFFIYPKTTVIIFSWRFLGGLVIHLNVFLFLSPFLQQC